VKGCDYSWDRPDLDCLWDQGVRFIVRYGSRDPSKNLAPGELDAALDRGMSVAVVWQEGKTQMMRGYDGGVTDARDAKALFDGLGLAGIPVHYSCDQETSVLSSADLGKIDAYLDGAISVTGLARNGMYGDYNILRRQFDRGKIKFGWQTYAWSGGKWESRAQLRQVQNNVSVCGGLIDWDESTAADFGQWPRPGSATPVTEDEDYMIKIPPGDAPGDSPDIGYSFPKFYTQMGLCADTGRLGGSTVKCRFAFHRGGGGWKVVEVSLTAASPKAVINFGEKGVNFDGAGIRRMDDVPITLYPNFA
jgi:Rv2525c-like, glycoside hydrolase-like domain